MAPETHNAAMRSALILVLGDQLSESLTSLNAADRTRDRVLMVEVMEEATYVRHHKKKIAFLFSAMRHFAVALRSVGWTVDYVRLDDPKNSGSFTGEAARAVERHRPSRIVVTEPGEWRVLSALQTWPEALGVPIEILQDDRFLCSRAEFAQWAGDRKQLRMEHFYRRMRRKTGLLMAGDEPEGGRWNFDAENRKPPKPNLVVPSPVRFEPDTITQEVLDLVAERFASHFGDLEPFWFGVTTDQAHAALDHFIAVALPSFGDYQDAMSEGERFLFHSVLSLYLNCGLLDP